MVPIGCSLRAELLKFCAMHQRRIRGTNCQKVPNGKFNLLCCFQSNIRKSHWVPDKLHAQCCGCKKAFRFFFRRHHCRRCGKVFCYRCSSYRIRLNEDAEFADDGVLHRACNTCHDVSTERLPFYNSTDNDVPLTSSHFNTFLAFRNTAYKLKLKNTELSNFCEPILKKYEAKSENNNRKKRSMNKICPKCSTFRLPTTKKTCRNCNKYVCKHMSSKQVVTCSNAEDSSINISITTNYKISKQTGDKCIKYRICDECRDRIEKHNFDKRLFETQQNMSQLREKLLNSEILSTQGGLWTEFLQNYDILKTLKPSTQSQNNLLNGIREGMLQFYIKMKEI